MPIDLNSLPLRSRSQGNNNFLDLLRRSFPDIQNTAAWRNRPQNANDSAAQFRYWLGPFLNNPNSQLGRELGAIIQQAAGRGGEPVEDPNALNRFGRDNPSFYTEFARQWGLQTPPPISTQGLVLQSGESDTNSLLLGSNRPEASIGYDYTGASGGGSLQQNYLTTFGNAIEDIADDVGFLKDPGDAENDWRSAVNALGLVGGVLGVGYGLEGLMGTGAGASAGTGTGGTMFSAGSSNPSYLTAATAPAPTGTTAGMLGGAGTSGWEGISSIMNPGITSELGAVSPGLMSGLSVGGGAPSSFGLSALTNAEFGASSPFAGMSELDLRNLATNLATTSGASPSSAQSLIDRLLDNEGLGAAVARGAQGLVEYFGGQSALNDAMDLANQMSRNAQFTPYNVSGPAGGTTFNGTNIHAWQSPQSQNLTRQAQGITTGAYGDLTGLNLNDYINNYVNWARQVAAPYEERGREALSSRLLNTGMLGGEAGARQVGEYERGLNEADLNRLIAGETLGRNRWNTTLNTWQTGANQLQNLWQAPLVNTALGLEAGRMRSGAAQIANTYPWNAGQQQAAGRSSMWSNIGNSVGNLIGSLWNQNRQYNGTVP